MITKQDIGRTLKAKREEIDMSYYRLAKETGLTVQQLHAIEDGSTSYVIDSLLKVENVLKADIFQA